VELFDVIHSLDSERLAEEVERQAAKQARAIDVLIQVNVSGEATKFGCNPEETSALARTVMHLPHLRLKGLMTLAPFAEDPEQARPHFRRLRQLRDELAVACSLQPAACSLSMGMSQDFEVAIEEGADVVRIGTAIFGTRNLRSAG
jgi:pyridoxal phosphate enzyme (YggS family)